MGATPKGGAVWAGREGAAERKGKELQGQGSLEQNLRDLSAWRVSGSRGLGMEAGGA